MGNEPMLKGLFKKPLITVLCLCLTVSSVLLFALGSAVSESDRITVLQRKTLELAVLMMATLCIPAAAWDIPCCSEPWTENPEYLPPEYRAYGNEIHEVIYRTTYDCSHCGGPYIEEVIEYEPHSFFWEDSSDGESYWYCSDCGFRKFP